MKELIVGLGLLMTTIFIPASQMLGVFDVAENVLAEQKLDLNTRAGGYVGEVFSYNILFAVDKFGDELVLEPGEVFAFHKYVASEFRDQSLKTGYTQYEAREGYKTTLGLPGNGVCHLASLMNWTASEAGLAVTARVNHDFALVPGVPREYGTSIRYMPDGSRNTANQNLYIENTLEYPVKFVFETENEQLVMKVIK